MTNNLRRRLIDLLGKSLQEHRASDDDTLVLKTVIEDKEIQRILREIMEAYDPESMDDIDGSSPLDELPEPLTDLVDQLKQRQREILSELDSEESSNQQ